MVEAASGDTTFPQFRLDETNDTIVFVEDGSLAADLAEVISLEDAAAMAAGPELHFALSAIVEAARNGEANIHPLLVEQAEAAVAAGSYKL